DAAGQGGVGRAGLLHQQMTHPSGDPGDTDACGHVVLPFVCGEHPCQTGSTGVRCDPYSPCAACNTSAAWPVTLTFLHTRAIFPSLSIRNVLRSMPMYFRPYIDFSTQVPYLSATARDSSDASGNVSLYLAANFSIGGILSGDTPITSSPILPSCGRASWNAQASLVQPGVSAFG